MAADLWQLANGWELVDWSLNVGGDGPTETASGGGFIDYRPPIIRSDDDEIISLAILLLL